ncbi:Hypothetical predicted protein [Mytilus galloprovincialis]|uniref:EF-hand domain-containing protein n=2 Tax=Mytilus galloprovincialis TaxID=29158 RepID=A0A8B6H0M5_MYTGA|nr:Hypothetical predicted protein [Mytilus galloprovincialis]
MEFLNHKWKLWYKSLDVNHDGKISFADVEESRSKFAELHKLLGDKASGVKIDMEGWWIKYILQSKDREISLEQFLERCGSEYQADKAKYTAKMTECFNVLFDVIDTNKDRSIELSEYIIAFQAFGHENENLVRKSFELLNPKDGLIPLKDIVNSWIQFTTSDDPHKKDVVKESFEEGV